MLDFACKRIELEEVVRCGLAISKSEYALIRFLLRNRDNWYSSEQLSARMHLDKSTIQRSLKKLFEKEVINRKQRNLESGGYVFIYQTKNRQALIEKISSIVQDWTKRVLEEMKNW